MNARDVSSPRGKLLRLKDGMLGSESRGNAKLKIGRAVSNELLDELHVAVGGFDENLRLTTRTNTVLQMLHCLLTRGFFDRKIA